MLLLCLRRGAEPQVVVASLGFYFYNQLNSTMPTAWYLDILSYFCIKGDLSTLWKNRKF